MTSGCPSPKSKSRLHMWHMSKSAMQWAPDPDNWMTWSENSQGSGIVWILEGSCIILMVQLSDHFTYRMEIIPSSCKHAWLNREKLLMVKSFLIDWLPSKNQSTHSQEHDKLSKSHDLQLLPYNFSDRRGCHVNFRFHCRRWTGSCWSIRWTCWSSLGCRAKMCLDGDFTRWSKEGWNLLEMHK